MDSRSDVSLLAEKYPEVAARYCALRQEVARQGLFQEQHVLQSEQNARVSKSLKLAHDLEALEDMEVEIRELPDFSRFQLPPTEHDMLDLSRDNPIVCVNLTNHGCQAFLLVDGSIRYVELPEMSSIDTMAHIPRQVIKEHMPSRIPKYVKGSSIAYDQGDIEQDISAEKTSTESMQWLWNAVVQPVLAELGLLWETAPPSSLPGLSWVSSGAVALLPLHAAGNHEPDSTANTMSHIVSSYTPHRSLNTRKVHHHIEKILVVTMPTTPSCAGAYHDPVNADNEVSAIKSHLASPDSIEILSNPEPCHVLERLPKCSMVHFACHGQVHPINPSQSALLLGKNDLAELTVANIRALNLGSAKIAYLSACSTAKLGGENVTDEVVHLASTFQLAGFQDVIGSLWTIDDTLAGRLAAKFYHFLLGQSSKETIPQVSRALHKATRDLKEELRKENTDGDANIFQWAPFVHFGPSSASGNT